MADQETPSEAVGAASELRNGENVKASDIDGSDADLVSEVLSKAEREVEARRAVDGISDGVQEGQHREASPAISEGSVEGDAGGDHEGAAAAVAAADVGGERVNDIAPGSPAGAKKSKKKEDKSIGRSFLIDALHLMSEQQKLFHHTKQSCSSTSKMCAPMDYVNIMPKAF